MRLLLDTHVALWAIVGHADLHRDPIDRLLVAQALHEPLRLITHDAVVKAYSDSFVLI